MLEEAPQRHRGATVELLARMRTVEDGPNAAELDPNPGPLPAARRAPWASSIASTSSQPSGTGFGVAKTLASVWTCFVRTRPS